MTPYDDPESLESPPDPNWQTIRDDIERLRTDLSALGEKSFADGQERLSEELAQLRDKATQLAAKVNATGRSAQADIAEYVRNNPITSVGGAFGLGLLLSAIFSRRS